ncbi:ankyrin repeat-containing domain protein, partial [Lactifluus subvellereus]
KYALTHGQPINSVIDGVLPLHAACSGGNDIVVRLLIENGADVNAPRLPRRYSDKARSPSAPIIGATGSTPLHFAAANGHTQVALTLLRHGARPDRADKRGVTPEVLARHNGWL